MHSISQPAKTATIKSRRLIAIAGNPNAGKTTIFNQLTGSRLKVGNYPGVTVERKVGQTRLPSGEAIDIVDLPGCYSLAARSPEEQIAHDVLTGDSPDLGTPDKLIVVIDASNLRRNLYLATQLQDLGIPMVIALNMMDIARERGFEVDADKLSIALGCPVVPLVARDGEGIHQLREALETDQCYCHQPGCVPRFIDCLPPALNEPVSTLAEGLLSSGLTDEKHARAEALWLLISTLEGDDAVKIPASEFALTRRILKEHHLSTRQVRAIETSARYRYLKDLMILSAAVEQDFPHRLTDILDRILLQRFAGPAIFLGVMAFVFQSIFSWAEPLMNLTESLMGFISGYAAVLIPSGLFHGLVVDGVIAGVGNVLIFLPQILILFLFIGLLEDLGYMARAAFLMDRIMARVGLDGRAFVPLLSSFACAIPGIMATRTISGRKDRLVTILVAPLMSCSARLPVYTLIIGTIFVANRPVWGVFTTGGLVLMSMYVISVVTGVTVAAIFKRTILKSPPPPLFLELPTYKLPSLRSVLTNLAERGWLFIRRAGTIIMAATVVIWAMMNLPVVHTDPAPFASARQEILSDNSLSTADQAAALRVVSGREAAAKVENSLGGQMGKLIEPVIKPLGFDWKIGIGIIASFAAREVFVSALAVVHGIEEADENTPTLRETLRNEKRADGSQFYTPLLGWSLMVFFLLACQCMSTVAIVHRETMSWRWPIFMIAYMSVLAWVGAFAVFQGGKLLGFS
ncbi:ferrous iron transport protein B [bacterium]|nr:MAG: ferrous iron transport protein B [bacterium]